MPYFYAGYYLFRIFTCSLFGLSLFLFCPQREQPSHLACVFFYLACIFFPKTSFKKRHNLCSPCTLPCALLYLFDYFYLVPFHLFMLFKNCGLAILHKNCFLPRSAFSSSNLSVVFISTDKWNGCESYPDACIQVVLSAIPLSCAPQL